MFHNFIFMVFSGAMVGIFVILTSLMSFMRSLAILENILENKFNDDQISYTDTVVETLAVFNRRRDGPLDFTLISVWALSCLLYLIAFCGLLWNWNRKRQTFRNKTSEDVVKGGRGSRGGNGANEGDPDETDGDGKEEAAFFARRNQSLHMAVVIIAIVSVVLCIICLILLFSVFRYANLNSMQSLLNDYGKNSEDGRTSGVIWNFTMTTSGICCGMDGAMDFMNKSVGSIVPVYCCEMAHDCPISEAILANVKGCRSKIERDGQTQITNILPIFLLLITAQIFIIVFGCWVRFCQLLPSTVRSGPSGSSTVLLTAE
uniref:Tetraspanin family n=1 Tax=Schistocephalus solidus TaxID=70667 RepID=A0A0V0JBV9_SCHSO